MNSNSYSLRILHLSISNGFVSSKIYDKSDDFDFDLVNLVTFHVTPPGARWHNGRVSDSGARGRGFHTYLRRVVSLSKNTFNLRKVLVIPRKRWLRPDMTGKLLIGTLSINTNKQKNLLCSVYFSTYKVC